MHTERHVLVVEDDPDIRECVADVLQADGYGVSTARDGLDALTWLRGPDARELCAVVVDVMMPRMSGPDFVREARRSGLLNGTPIITMTAYDAEIEGAAAHVHKPFAIDELVGAIHYACGT